MNNPYYCPLIEYQLTYDHRGDASFCCQFDDLFTIDQYKEKLNFYKNKMFNGEKIKPCNSCWKDEEQGLKSLRQSAIDDFKYNNYNENESDGLLILDIRISNECNLACTMCDTNASSLWGNLKKINSTKILSIEQQNYLIDQSDNLKKLSIQGGEPFYGNNFINFVNRLPNKKTSRIGNFHKYCNSKFGYN